MREVKDKISLNEFKTRIGDAAYRVEARRLAAAINRSPYVGAVFIPFCFPGSAIEEIKKPKTVVFPDLVTSVYPTRFFGHVTNDDIENFSDCIRHADSIVCYSQYTVDYHLLPNFSAEVGTKPVHVIPQGFFVNTPETKAQEAKIKFMIHFENWCESVPDYALDEIVYVVYPSVDRPHKNLLTLLRAIKILLHKRHFNVKLITTSHYLSPDAYEFIWSSRLFLDVLYAPGLDQDELEYVVRNARLVVHPSLSEGGDIFNFSRGVASGTPVLMADVPVVREMFERWDVPAGVFQPWLFSATDAERLADMIEHGIANRAELLDAQRHVLATLATYDYRGMAAKYYEIYSSPSFSDEQGAGRGILAKT